jgi:hypothetical protein
MTCQRNSTGKQDGYHWWIWTYLLFRSTGVDTSFCEVQSLFLCSILLIIVGRFVFLTTPTAQTPGVKLGCSRRVGSSCSDSDTRRATHVNNPMVRNARGKTRFGISVNRTYCATGIPNWLTKSWWQPQNL